MDTRFLIEVTIVLFLFNSSLYAKSGCCSHHGGVAGCNSTTGFNICADGTDSPSCTCGYPSDYNSLNNNYDSNSTTPIQNSIITIHKCTDKKGVVHFSDKNLSPDCK
ncbi:DUF4124 domain-containing protein [Legionella sp. PC997]|uniref:DUF4124 domain-containing protein n=1 Tax=Legionella sp. PC997 TaxID=2755562 RepID=UPI0015F9242D|nr:DUF4124 domain-containing protein [Legionella sp. PC997]QMT59703.1 hypothetical protein HBNCFIEN_01070 [Legionella sp. PC997]